MLSANRPKCKFFFSKRGCALGTTCRFSHSTDPPRFQNQDTGQHVSVSKENSGDQASEITTSPAHSNSASCKPKVCSHFKRFGSCRFSGSCRFLHTRDENQEPATSASYGGKVEETSEGTPGHETVEKIARPDGRKENETASKQVCRYFKRGNCWRGNRCKFLHRRGQNAQSQGQGQQEGEGVPALEKVESGEAVEAAVKEMKEKVYISKPATTRPSVQRPQAPHQTLKRSQASAEDVKRLRDLEITQFKKRYPKAAVTEDSDSGAVSSQITFQPSDPDWPFDVKLFELEVTFPRDYPKEMFSVKLPLDQDVPDTVRHYLEVSIQEWVTERGYTLEKQDQVQMQYRPFLRWLDRSIEDFVTEGLRQLRRELTARAAGIEIVPAHRLQAMYPAAASSRQDQAVKEQEANAEEDSNQDSQEEAEEDGAETEGDSEEGSQEGSDDSWENERAQDGRRGMPVETERRGTEVGLRHLQLLEGAATLRCQRLSLVLQCGRCKGRADLATPGGRVEAVDCGKCHQRQLLTFRPCLAHSFSSILGYLDVADCSVFDVILQDSAFLAACLACNKETLVTSLPPGSVRDAWCQHCHQRMKLAAEGARISIIDPASLTLGSGNVHQVAMPKSKKLGRDPAIQPGKPLPANGTCRHYKKSFRWLRFPCCGMAYPCDLCHDENETDHDMKFANRMICGFCCKEQPYASDRPCVSCLKAVTKVFSTHWEGGKGCRDRLKMSKSDSQKYGSMHKTTSRHAQKLKELSSKKKTKLRHS